MKFKKIVGFGDSWMYGDELLDPDLLAQDSEAQTCFTQNDPYREQHCFLGLLGAHYDVPVQNFGLPGGSLQSSIWTYIWWCQHEQIPLDECLVLVGHTDNDRTSYYDINHIHYSNDPPWNKFVHSAWVHAGANAFNSEWTDMAKRHMVLCENHENAKLNYWQAAMFFDGQSARKGFPLFQFDIMPSPYECLVDTKIWHGECMTMWFRDHVDNQARQLIKKFGHPNERGHEYIRDRLISVIDHAILA